jgi:S-adenosylmethionine:tRNA ribosyltransferase-isomerase
VTATLAARGEAFDFHLPPDLEAHAPPEASGRRDRSDVRMMVSVGTRPPRHARFADLPDFLRPGDVLVVNTSATLPAAVDGTLADGTPVVVHFSNEVADGHWVVELRALGSGGATTPMAGGTTGQAVELRGGGLVELSVRLPGSSRLWDATVVTPEPVADFLGRHGRAIRYGYVPRVWPIDAYQTVFARRPGSAEMPSASRPFTADLVVDLIAEGVLVVPVTLHTGVSSLERHERPYPERFEVPAATARVLNLARSGGRSRGRVIAAGTTTVRAVESAVGHDGLVHAAHGWTDLLVTPEHGVRAVDGLLTGWHQPEATHLLMLEAVAGRRPLELAYPEAVAAGYRWHEFGDVHLLLPDEDAGP